MSNVNVVHVFGNYAVRKKGFLFDSYLDLKVLDYLSHISWVSRRSIFFKDCLTGDLDRAKRAMSYLKEPEVVVE